MLHLMKNGMCFLALLAFVGCATTYETATYSHEPADDPAYPKELRPVPSFDERSAALVAITDYSFGQHREALSHLQDLVTAALPDPEASSAFSTELAAFLHTPASHDAKVFVCRQWARIGQPEDAAAVASLLADAQLAEMARYALEPVPGEAVDAELMEALEHTVGPIRIGIINSLGARRATTAEALLEQLAQAGNDEALAAQHALAKIRE